MPIPWTKSLKIISESENLIQKLCINIKYYKRLEHTLTYFLKAVAKAVQLCCDTEKCLRPYMASNQFQFDFIENVPLLCFKYFKCVSTKNFGTEFITAASAVVT